MDTKVRSLVIGYGLAIGCTVLATCLRLFAFPHLADEVPFVSYFPAVFVTALYGRFGPTLLTVALSGLAAAHFFIPPDDSLVPGTGAGWTGLALFGFFGVAVAWLGSMVHRKSEQAHQERERFAVTLASIGDGVIVTDEHERVVFLNAVAERLTGWSDADARGRSVEAVFHIVNETTRKPAENRVARVLQEGRIVGLTNHTILIARDGTEKSIDDSAAPIRERSGNTVGVVLVFRDVTLKRDAQRATGRLAALVDSSEDAILGQTFEGVITDWNSAAERLFGYSAEEIIGQSVFSTIVAPERKEELLQILQRVKEGGWGDQLQTVRQRHDGRSIPISVRISPIHDAEGNVIGASAIDRDISQQLAAERRRNARLAVTQILAQSHSLEQIMPEILEAVCTALDWDMGCFWRPNRDETLLTCQEIWHHPSRSHDEFRAATAEESFGPGIGLPGQVWTSGRPVWNPDVSADPAFVRGPQAQASGLHGAFACPVKGSQKVWGVLVCYSREVLQPDEDLLEMLTTVCGQIGQFIERQEAVQNLHRSERELSDFFENAVMALHWVGPDGTILRVNRAELDMLGYSRDEYLGHHISEFHADPVVITDILRCLSAGEQIHDCAAQLRCRDGSIKHVLIDSNVLWEGDRFIHTRCFTRDVSESKQAEASLFESEERLRLACQAGGMGTWEWDVHTNDVIWSTTLEEIHGLTPGSFAGTIHTHHQNIHPDDQQRVQETMRQIVDEGQEQRLEYRIVWPDDSVHWVEARGRLFRDDFGQPHRVIGVCSDVTERKSTEQSLQFLAEASKSLTSLVDYKSTLQKVARLSVPDFADWCAVDMLDAQAAVQRLAVAHVDPAREILIEELHEQFSATSNCPWSVMSVLDSGETEWAAEVNVAALEKAARDEAQLDIMRKLNLKSYLCVPLRAQKQIAGVITFAFGDSGRRYGADDLVMAEDFAHRAAIAIENARLYQKVREADQRKDEFLAMLAHELRNPLVPIRSGLDILAMASDVDVETIKLMQDQVEHIVRLVDDLLDVSRIMRGKVDLRMQHVQLSVIVKRSVETIRPLVNRHGHQLLVNLPENSVWLHADPVRLIQVIENLLNNASKYMDDGGQIELSVETQSHHVIIRVRDTGIGIDEELLATVFDLFTQSSRSLDRAQGGLGIGLTLVQRLVQLHGGTVSVSSDGPGFGSTFAVKLPIAEAPGDVSKEAHDLSDAGGLMRRILVVDDNVGSAVLLGKLLGMLGSDEVETVHDGRSALAAIRQTHPDIVLLDIGLPGMDGYQVAREVRQDPEFDDLLLVALTGYGQEEDRQRSREVGFDQHLVKPPSIDQMKAVLSHPKLTTAKRRSRIN